MFLLEMLFNIYAAYTDRSPCDLLLSLGNCEIYSFRYLMLSMSLICHACIYVTFHFFSWILLAKALENIYIYKITTKKYHN